MGGFQSGPSLKIDGVLELKITKKRMFLKAVLLEQPRSEKWNKQMYIFEKGGLSVQVDKVESLGAAQAEKNAGLSGGTYPHCSNMGVPRPLPPGQTDTERKTKENSLINYLCLTDR